MTVAIVAHDTNASRRSNLAAWLILTALSGLAPCISLYLFAAAAYVHLGHWPSYANPDPRLLPSSFELPSVVVVATWLFWIPITTLIGVATARRIYEPALRFWSVIKGVPLVLTVLAALSGLFLGPLLGLVWPIFVAAVAQVIGSFVWERDRAEGARRPIWPLLLPVFLMALCVWIIYNDPHGVLDWFMD